MAITPKPSVNASKEDKIADQFIAGAGKPTDEEIETQIFNMRFRKDVLAKVDAAAKRRGMNRTAWFLMVATAALGLE